jgi:hypothetical protein
MAWTALPRPAVAQRFHLAKDLQEGVQAATFPRDSDRLRARQGDVDLF